MSMIRNNPYDRRRTARASKKWVCNLVAHKKAIRVEDAAFLSIAIAVRGVKVEE